MSRPLSRLQLYALLRLALGPLKYTVAGYAAATQSNASMGATYVCPQTIQALDRRGYCKVAEKLGRRARRATITPAGRRAARDGR
jgi:hypothetical protein